MASDMTGTASDTVQCPICFQDFHCDAINGHLDVCLTKSDAHDGRLSTDSDAGTPLKKFCYEAAPKKLTGGEHRTAAPSTSHGAFSMFRDTNTSFPNKRLGGGAVNKAVKRSFVAETEFEPGCSGTRPNNGGQTLNATQDLNATDALCLRTLLTSNKPLAEMLRPNTLVEYFGQNKVVGEQTLLRSLLDSQEIPSLILWGPPGCGKTTLAHIIGSNSKKKGTARFVRLSATGASTADVREVIKQAQNELRLCKRRTILFIDEIHHFNKSQQDTFLPHVECGTVTLIGATTENPSFQVISALLSRCRVLVLEKLSVEAMGSILDRAVAALGMAVLEREETDPERPDPPADGNQ